jgi:hypothetical protein
MERESYYNGQLDVSKRNRDDTRHPFLILFFCNLTQMRREKRKKKKTSEKQKILYEIQGSVYIEGQLVTHVCLSLSSVLMRQDTEMHKRTRENPKGRSKQ